MAKNVDLSSLSPSQRREEIIRLTEEGLMTAAHIVRLAAQGDETSLLLVKERLERYEYRGFEYYMALYELERKSELFRRISILEDMIKTSYDRKYVLELAGLYCALAVASEGDDPEVEKATRMARRTCIRLQNFFKDGREVEDAKKLLEALDQGKLKEAAEAYSSYAAPRPAAPARTEPPKAEPVKVSMPVPEKAKPQPAPPRPKTMEAPKLRKPETAQVPEVVKTALRGLIGMEDLKQQLSKIYWTITLQKEREKKLNIPAEPVDCNFILLGNPGTGKTTVARRMAQLLFRMGVRREDKLVEVNRTKLVSKYIGETARETMEQLEAALGGVLFVDEAYTLYKKATPNDFGQEALETIMKYMEDHRNDLTVIFAGYQSQMDEMFREGNPGLASRFQYRITLPDYTDRELLQIAYGIAKAKGLTFDAGAEDAFLRQVERQRLGKNFGNARTVRTIMEEAVKAQAVRLLGLTAGRRLSNSELIRLDALDFESADVGKESLTDLLSEMDGLIGLEKAKEQIRTLVQSVQTQQRLQNEGKKTDVIPALNTAFLGNPGTGKTTMARLLGRICRSLGVLKRGELFVEAKREDLIGNAMMSAPDATKKKIQEAMGGVLFIDEAYSICSGKDDRAGQQAITCLIAEMENHRKDIMVILAGYTREMEELFSVNPGFKSRVPNRIEFADYTKDQLMDIFEKLLKEDHLTLEPGWRKALEPVLATRLAQQGAEKFGNARGARNLVNEAKQHWVDRGAEGTQITLADLVWETGDQESVAQLLEQLNGLEGLDSVKRQVQELIHSIQARKRDQAAGIKRSGFHSLHTVFVGNPGTGKTTVAEILGKLYTALGVLPGGPVKTCTRDNLVAGYQGQTAIQVKKAVEEAMGGILFIDEAYALCRDEHDTFGQEAVDTLVPALENHRDGLMVILAGYPDDMDRFLSKNPGLKSRFPTTLTFEDYSTDQLLHIFRMIVEKEGFSLAEGWQEVVAPQFEVVRTWQGKNFGNAREARNMADKAIRHRDVRTAELDPDAEGLCRIELSDLSDLAPSAPEED